MYRFINFGTTTFYRHFFLVLCLDQSLAFSVKLNLLSKSNFEHSFKIWIASRKEWVRYIGFHYSLIIWAFLYLLGFGIGRNRRF